MVEVDGTGSLDLAPEAVWAGVADPARLSDWVPTMRRAEPAGEAEVHLEGESHGHRYSMNSLLRVDEGDRRLHWGAEGDEGYRGWLQVVNQPSGSEVHIHVTIPHPPIGPSPPPAPPHLPQALEAPFH